MFNNDKYVTQVCIKCIVQINEKSLVERIVFDKKQNEVEKRK